MARSSFLLALLSLIPMQSCTGIATGVPPMQPLVILPQPLTMTFPQQPLTIPRPQQPSTSPLTQPSGNPTNPLLQTFSNPLLQPFTNPLMQPFLIPLTQTFHNPLMPPLSGSHIGQCWNTIRKSPGCISEIRSSLFSPTLGIRANCCKVAADVGAKCGFSLSPLASIIAPLIRARCAHAVPGGGAGNVPPLASGFRKASCLFRRC